MQFVRHNWFPNEIIGPDLIALGAGGLAGHRRDNDDRNALVLLLGLDLTHHFEPVCIGHVQVRDDEVKMMLFQLLESYLAVGAGPYHKPFFFQEPGQGLSQDIIIFHQQNVRHLILNWVSIVVSECKATP
jgi:hypothetical protein